MCRSVHSPLLLLTWLLAGASSLLPPRGHRTVQPGRATTTHLSLRDDEYLPHRTAEAELEGYGAPRRDWPHEWSGPGAEERLFRNRFLVGSDLCIRVPIEAPELLRAFVVHSHLAGCFHMAIDSFRPLGKVKWSPDAQRMLSLPNGGGSSILSEALGFEMLARAFGAGLEKTETELSYKLTADGLGSKMTDFAIDLFGGYPIGVSVTRAYKWRGPSTRGLSGSDAGADSVASPPPSGTEIGSGLEPSDVRRLLMKKLVAINMSSRTVRNHRFRKQLLLVWALTHRDAMLLEAEYAMLPASLRANTVMLIARCNGVRWIW